MKINVWNVVEMVWVLTLVVFTLKGILSEYGYFSKFTETQIYQFAYLSLVMSAFMFFEKYIFSVHKEKTD